MRTQCADLAQCGRSAPSLRTTIRNTAFRPFALSLCATHLLRSCRPVRMQSSSALPGRATRTSTSRRTWSCDLCETFADQGRRRKLEAGRRGRGGPEEQRRQSSRRQSQQSVTPIAGALDSLLTLLFETDLVGTDIDTITSSLPTGLQLYAVLPKLVVSIIFLYVLLGWSAFVALGAVSAFIARRSSCRD